MIDERVRALIRHFTENGVKLLLQNAANVRDLLVLARAAWVELIDFRRLKVAGTTFVQPDFRNVEADLVLTAPLRLKGRGRQTLVIYVLIEHRSEPDEMMPLRLLEYVVAIFKAQAREWETAHGSARGVRLQPVLPVVFYTGSRTWEEVGSLADLIEEGVRFADVTPALTPRFLNLGGTAPGRLEAEGGWLGQVLRVVQARQADESEFRGVLREAVSRLEEMPAAERARWRELMTYLDAFVYHERDVSEVPRLRKLVTASLRSESKKQEIEVMRRTMAEVDAEKGEVRGLRKMLFRQLRARYGEVSPAVIAMIETTEDVAQLEKWGERFATAKTLEEIGIAPPSEKTKKGRR